MTPNRVFVMAAYFEASERMADAIDQMLQVRVMIAKGQGGDIVRYERLAETALLHYREAWKAYNALPD